MDLCILLELGVGSEGDEEESEEALRLSDGVRWSVVRLSERARVGRDSLRRGASV